MQTVILNFRIKNYYFSTRLLPFLVFISLFSLLISLGCWQVHRGDAKQQRQVQFSRQQQAKPIHLNSRTTLTHKQVYSPIIAEGHFDNKHSFLLDNKSYHYQIGYEVLTPFILRDGVTAILVNRGWIPLGQNRNTLPLVKPIRGNVTIKGLLLWPQKTFTLAQIVEKKWPRRLQTLTPEFLQQSHFKPFIVVIDKPQAYSFIPLWRLLASLPASRHYGYALQWFALSVTLCIAFFLTHTVRHEV
jgi:surfeit locus 1 family protein